MVLHTDSAGFHYLGNAVYKNSILDASNYYQQANLLSGIYNDLNSLNNLLNYNHFDYGISQADWNNTITGIYSMRIAFNGDSNGTLGRFLLNVSNSAYWTGGTYIYDSNATSSTTSAITSTPYNYGLNNFDRYLISASENSFFFMPIYASTKHDYYQVYNYFLAVRAININGSEGIYTDDIHKHFGISYNYRAKLGTPTINAFRTAWKNPSENGLLFTGNGDFAPSCSNVSPTPNEPLLLDAIFHHDAPSINNPWIGVADNLIKFAHGTFTKGLIYEQDIGDNGSPYWIALDKITATKTLFVRVNAII